MITKQRKNTAGFTLVEMMVALIVASIVLAAVATLAQATTAADDATSQMGREQAQLRQVSMRLTDLIKRANKTVVHQSEEIVLWHDKNEDGTETANELTQVLRGADTNQITITHNGISEVYPQCKNIEFKYKNGDTYIAVYFDLEENGVVVRHSINGNLRAAKR